MTIDKLNNHATSLSASDEATVDTSGFEHSDKALDERIVVAVADATQTRLSWELLQANFTGTEYTHGL